MKQNPEFCPDGERVDDIIAILNEYIYGFQDRNPNAYKTGMSRRVSLNKALDNMGFASDKGEDSHGKFDLAVTKWQNREREELTEIASRYGIEIVNGNQSRQHMSREQYIIEQKKEELKKKEISIKNCVSQLNDFMTYDTKGKEFYYSVELLKREKELEKLKREFDEMTKEYRLIKEKGEFEVS